MVSSIAFVVYGLKFVVSGVKKSGIYLGKDYLKRKAHYEIHHLFNTAADCFCFICTKAKQFHGQF